MLSRATAVRFDRPVASGRTKPCFAGCVSERGEDVDVILKFAAGCDMKVRSLMVEAVVAMLAGDLDLPVPEPFLVMVEPEFAATIPDPEIGDLARSSLGWNFGSRKLPPGYSIYPAGKSLPGELLPVAAEIVAFDVFMANPDRAPANPNLLFDGRNLAIYDHELALLTDGLLGWKPPWEPESLRIGPESHVLLEQVRGKSPDLSRLAGAFEAISEARLADYRRALPPEWVDDGVAVDGILAYLGRLRDNIRQAVAELARGLR